MLYCKPKSACGLLIHQLLSFVEINKFHQDILDESEDLHISVPRATMIRAQRIWLFDSLHTPPPIIDEDEKLAAMRQIDNTDSEIILLKQITIVQNAHPLLPCRRTEYSKLVMGKVIVLLYFVHCAELVL